MQLQRPTERIYQFVKTALFANGISHSQRRSRSLSGNYASAPSQSINRPDAKTRELHRYMSPPHAVTGVGARGNSDIYRRSRSSSLLETL